MQKDQRITAFVVHEHPNTCVMQQKDLQTEVLSLMQKL